MDAYPNNIAKYLSYSEENGYTVLKSGWYFISLFVHTYSSTAADCTVQ